MKTLIALIATLFITTPVYAGSWDFGLDGGLAVPTQNYFPTNSGDYTTDSYPYFQALEASEGWMTSAYITHTVGKPWIHFGILGSFDTTGASSTSPVMPGIMRNIDNNMGIHYSGSNPGLKTNLGMLESFQIMPYLRLNPWTFGNWTPFFGLGFGLSWNQWNVQSIGTYPFTARISNGLPIRIELGTDYALSSHFGLESLLGFEQQDPLGLVNLPFNVGGMDQQFNMSLVFFEIGFHFTM